MEHPYIDDQLIVERYALGKLAPEERMRFERHYLHCQDCLEQVTLIDRLSRGFKRTAADPPHPVADEGTACPSSSVDQGRRRRTLAMTKTPTASSIAAVPSFGDSG